MPLLHSVDSYRGKLQVQLVLSFMEELVAYEQMFIMKEFPIKGIVQCKIYSACVMLGNVWCLDDFALYFDVLIRYYTYSVGATRWRSWLRHCATNRKVAGLTPDGVILNFY